MENLPRRQDGGFMTIKCDPIITINKLVTDERETRKDEGKMDFLNCSAEFGNNYQGILRTCKVISIYV